MNVRILALAAVVLTAGVGVYAAVEPQEEKIQVLEKKLSGEISAISSSFLAVVHGNDPASGAALEAAFTLDKSVRVIHQNSLKDLKVGDTVSVSYLLTKEKLDDGRIAQKKTVKSITFVKAAPKGLISQDSAPAAEAVQPLVLKGAKGEAGNE